jgi:YggT family protein
LEPNSSLTTALRSHPINPYVSQFTFLFIQLLVWSVIARALVSWLPIDQSSPLYQVLFRVTEPICEPLRRIMPNTGMMDLSPIAAIVILIVLGYLVTGVTAA